MQKQTPSNYIYFLSSAFPRMQTNRYKEIEIGRIIYSSVRFPPSKNRDNSIAASNTTMIQFILFVNNLDSLYNESKLNMRQSSSIYQMPCFEFIAIPK